ncbi:hypothetical protein A0H81_05059 [Grifola frondosa]|uniref:Uncharacterized protein n=1 Tax=Grifola frondosa TaxID=5627 RepID=A0A1C7MCK7_GRIFR|nr:hypothetical protein A0H81_05059 [Grifola frondosa]
MPPRDALASHFVAPTCDASSLWHNPQTTHFFFRAKAARRSAPAPHAVVCLRIGSQGNTHRLRDAPERRPPRLSEFRGAMSDRTRPAQLDTSTRMEITFRYREAEERTKVVSQLRETLNNYMNQATSNDERFSHIDEKDKQTIVEKCATIQKWLEDQMVRQLERPKNVDPVLTSAEVLKKKDEIICFATPTLTKPKVGFSPDKYSDGTSWVYASFRMLAAGYEVIQTITAIFKDKLHHLSGSQVT